MSADTIPVPETPPLAWIKEDPDWYVDGQSLRVDFDTGRACGIVQPKPGRRYIGAGAFGHAIPERYPDETFSDFHVGDADFLDGDKIVTRQIGSIAVEGGHTDQSPDFAVLAEKGTLKERIEGAKNWLQRRGPNAHAIRELGVYGRVTRVESGPNRGALKFNGAAYPWLTKDQARAINATTHSSEQWKHPDHGMREQFIGVARVHQSSYRGAPPVALMASLNDDAMGVVVEGPAENDDAYVTSEPVAVMAEISASQFGGLEQTVEQLADKISRLETLVAEFIIGDQDGLSLTLESRVDSIGDRIPALESTVDQILIELQRLTNTQPQDTTPPTT